MHKLALAAVLASCGLPYTPLDDPPPPAPADAGMDADAPAVIAAPLPTARRPLTVHAMHAARLRALAVTEDGALAVSADLHGSLRWWASLDGTREPLVLPVRAATALAIVHDSEGGAFAAIDEVGQVEVVRVSAAGEISARGIAELARPAVEIRAIEHAFLARCDDGTIVRIGVDGRRSGELRPRAHQHVASLAARRGAVIAILDTGGEIHGQWLDPVKMKWGELTPSLDIDGTRVELSPEHHKIAGVVNGGKTLAIVDLGTGFHESVPITADFVDPLLRPVGFAGDDSLALVRSGSVMWDGVSAQIATGEAAITDIGVVAETEGGLVISNATSMVNEYIGYQLATVVHTHALAGGGWLATDGRTIAAIDDHLRTTRAYEFDDVATPKYGFYDLRIVDDHHALASGSSGSTQDLYLLDLELGTATVIGSGIGSVDYDAARQAVAYRTKDAFVLAHYDSRRHELGTPASFPFSGNSSVMHFLDAAKTHDLAVVIEAEYGYDVESTATITRIRAIRADGTLELGNVKSMTLTPRWWRSNGNVDALVGPGWAPPTTAVVRPSPDGKLVATFDGNHITLRDARGAERWTVPAAGATDLEWSKSGVLAGHGDGMARFDVATGEVSALQCGWRFGRWTKQLSAMGATMCEQSWTAAE